MLDYPSGRRIEPQRLLHIAQSVVAEPDDTVLHLHANTAVHAKKLDLASADLLRAIEAATSGSIGVALDPARAHGGPEAIPEAIPSDDGSSLDLGHLVDNREFLSAPWVTYLEACEQSIDTIHAIARRILALMLGEKSDSKIATYLVRRTGLSADQARVVGIVLNGWQQTIALRVQAVADAYGGRIYDLIEDQPEGYRQPHVQSDAQLAVLKDRLLALEASAGNAN